MQEAIDAAVQSYQSAVLAKDVDAFMRLYDAGVRVFDAWGVWSYEGASAWRGAVQAWFESLGAGRVKVTFDDVQAWPAGEFAALSAIVTYAGLSTEGKELRRMQNRLSWVLRRDGAGLRIVHEHTSAPISFDESKAILRRS